MFNWLKLFFKPRRGQVRHPTATKVPPASSYPTASYMTQGQKIIPGMLPKISSTIPKPPPNGFLKRKNERPWEPGDKRISINECNCKCRN